MLEIIFVQKSVGIVTISKFRNGQHLMTYIFTILVMAKSPTGSHYPNRLKDNLMQPAKYKSFNVKEHAYSNGKQKQPHEVYLEIIANVPNIIGAVDDFMQSHQGEYVTKEDVACGIWDIPAGYDDSGNAIWLSSSRDRTIREAVSDLVKYTARGYVASSGEKGWYVTVVKADCDPGIADLTARKNEIEIRINGLKAAQDKLPERVDQQVRLPREFEMRNLVQVSLF